MGVKQSALGGRIIRLLTFLENYVHRVGEKEKRYGETSAGDYTSAGGYGAHGRLR